MAGLRRRKMQCSREHRETGSECRGGLAVIASQPLRMMLGETSAWLCLRRMARWSARSIDVVGGNLFWLAVQAISEVADIRPYTQQQRALGSD